MKILVIIIFSLQVCSRVSGNVASVSTTKEDAIEPEVIR